VAALKTEQIAEHKENERPFYLVNGHKKPDRKLTAAEKRLKALELRRAGWDYRAIAKEVGWKSPSSAHEAIKREVDGRLTEAADALRALEAERLDWMWRECVAVMEEQPHWKLWAIDRMLKIMERRAKLFGLDQPYGPDVAERGEAYLQLFEQAKADAERAGLQDMSE
jgi:hypothetical protein